MLRPRRKEVKMSRRGSPGVIADRLIAELESEFDLMRLERHMTDLEQKDERLAKEIDALRGGIEPPVPRCEAPRKASPIRRWRRALARQVRIFWLKARRKRLVEEWRRCSVMADDIRFGLRVAGLRSTRD